MIIKRFVFFIFIFIIFCGSASAENAGYYKNYPYEQVHLSQNEYDSILLLLRASADIMNYDCHDTDIHKLTRYVLYTKNNFKVLGYQPVSESSGDTLLKYCDSEFVDSVLYNVFRLSPEKPSADMLTKYYYYFSNGLYYYSGGFNTYFATDVIGISEVYKISDDTYYIIFPNTYTESGASPQLEFSSAIIANDSLGYYIKRIDMNSEPLSADTLSNYTKKSVYDLLPDIRKYMPAVIIIAGLAVIIFTACRYLI